MASALENYVNMVRRLSKSGYYGELAENLNDTIELLTKNYSMLDNVLGTLDTYQHSLGILYVLIAKFNSAQVSNAETTQMIQLFQKFIEFQNVTQVRFALHAYYELCHLFTTYVVDTPNCMLGIKLLALAIERIRGDCDTQLTPVHADLCQLSLKAINFKLALKFLDTDITTISTASDTRTNSPTVTQDVNTDAKYFLLYYYYGGMIYTAVKQYDRALYFYEVCISTPAMTMSHIMLEAYKKFIMVSLILHGKVIDIQKFSSQVLTRFMKPLAQMYHDLANAYATLSTDDLRNVMNKFTDVYNFDNNMGLVKLVVKSLYKKNIQRLTKTFLTLSLTDVAARVKLPNANEAEKLILKMIKSGEIYATINQKDGMVIFKESPEAFDSAEMFLKIQNNMSNVIELVKNINVMEEEILLNPVYIKKILGSLDDELTSQHGKSFVGDPTD